MRIWPAATSIPVSAHAAFPGTIRTVPFSLVSGAAQLRRRLVCAGSSTWPGLAAWPMAGGLVNASDATQRTRNRGSRPLRGARFSDNGGLRILQSFGHGPSRFAAGLPTSPWSPCPRPLQQGGIARPFAANRENQSPMLELVRLSRIVRRGDLRSGITTGRCGMEEPAERALPHVRDKRTRYASCGF